MRVGRAGPRVRTAPPAAALPASARSAARRRGGQASPAAHPNRGQRTASWGPPPHGTRSTTVIGAGTSGLSSSPATYNTTDEAHHHRSGTSDHPTPGPLAPYAADDPASGATRPPRVRHPAPGHGAGALRALRALRRRHRRCPARRRPPPPAWARDDEGDADGFVGPYTVLVVDGDPGGADVREAVARLAHDGPRAGIHVVCLAETEPASPASPVTDTYEAACAAAPTFRECGAVALLSGDVATALRLLRVAHGGTGGTRPGTARSGAAEVTYPGTGTGRPATDASRPDTGPASPRSESSGPGGVRRRAHRPRPRGQRHDRRRGRRLPRVGRAVRAGARPAEGGRSPHERHARVSAPLPQSARLLDELGLARATPASLLARWADAGDDKDALGGRAWAVLGAGPRGPVSADLATEGPHLLIEALRAAGARSCCGRSSRRWPPPSARTGSASC